MSLPIFDPQVPGTADRAAVPANQFQAAIDMIIANSTVTGRAIEPTPTTGRKEKIYCDKWVHEGTCAFTQRGCRYKHEMPFDKATQLSLGLNGLPNWFKRARDLKIHSGSDVLAHAVSPTAAPPQSSIPARRPATQLASPARVGAHGDWRARTRVGIGSGNDGSGKSLQCPVQLQVLTFRSQRVIMALSLVLAVVAKSRLLLDAAATHMICWAPWRTRTTTTRKPGPSSEQKPCIARLRSQQHLVRPHSTSWYTARCLTVIDTCSGHLGFFYDTVLFFLFFISTKAYSGLISLLAQ